MTSIQEAAERRAAAADEAQSRGSSGSQQGRAVAGPPDGVDTRHSAPAKAHMRSQGLVERDGKQYLGLTGAASVYETKYEMWDWAGPYKEEVGEAAGANSLAKGPDVVYQLNHGGIPFARSISGTLDLSEPGGVLQTDAFLNPKRTDAQDLVRAVDEGSITEMSFMFRILDGRWSPDYTEYRINEYDIDRGDVSPVTFGANPHTSISARAAQFALTNDVLRAARDFDAERRTLLSQALAPVPEDATVVEPAKLGARAIQDLRLLRASVDTSDLDVMARASLIAVLDDLIQGTGQLRAGDGPLAVLLNLRSEAVPAPDLGPAGPTRLSLAFVEREMAAGRRPA